MWGAAAVVLAAAIAILALSVRNRWSVIQPARDLRSYASMPAVLAEPAFQAGPIASGLAIDQELLLTERDVGIRIWLGAAYVGQHARARIELLAGPRGRACVRRRLTYRRNRGSLSSALSHLRQKASTAPTARLYSASRLCPVPNRSG